MAEVVVENLAPQADGRGGFCRGQKAGDWRERVEVVVGHDERGKAECFGLPGQIAPFFS